MTATIADLSTSRAKRLKALTQHVHERVDRSIMSAASFDDLDRYKRFLAVQYLFHRDVAALYEDARLQALVPGLRSRQRLALVTADLADLQTAPPSAAAPSFASGDTLDVPTALGWLYVVEGSNMGAALLRKEAAKLGLSDSHGARHLAPAPEGPAAHWRTFTSALDSAALNAGEEGRVTDGAIAAFVRVLNHVDANLG
ncbi:biliverdin-producing heme oxygenase [Pelagerythrobacter aerophilus]|uniref:Biliverdin-producing heme oxygenase n=1 Tax=Pelagerythrobacter aerophilus TaxID=2306995 RepID=A0A418NDI8_9SPHN|nr:biliverdin-producing heme oxygenase [Pelagerythrobacter aerophilus]RIV75396.1 biliverdin-producing heme oxygenase [Pelagerythrobacter aerophilus]